MSTLLMSKTVNTVIGPVTISVHELFPITNNSPMAGFYEYTAKFEGKSSVVWTSQQVPRMQMLGHGPSFPDYIAASLLRELGRKAFQVTA